MKRIVFVYEGKSVTVLQGTAPSLCPGNPLTHSHDGWSRRSDPMLQGIRLRICEYCDLCVYLTESWDLNLCTCYPWP